MLLQRVHCRKQIGVRDHMPPVRELSKQSSRCQP
jgi:hypothetical protein